MAKVKLYNLEGKESGDIELNDAIFGVAPKPEVVHQVYVGLEANRRQILAHTKTKGEVSGGGRKPWRQKGTGRARHGSIRSPLWVGGGITFGPRNTRNFSKKINQKMAQLATKMCLSDKVNADQFIVLENLPEDGKAKTFATLRKALPGAGRTTLILGGEKAGKLGLAIRNIKDIDLQRAQDVNVGDLLNHQFVIVSKAGVEFLEKRLAK